MNQQGYYLILGPLGSGQGLAVSPAVGLLNWVHLFIAGFNWKHTQPHRTAILPSNSEEKPFSMPAVLSDTFAQDTGTPIAAQSHKTAEIIDKIIS